MFEVLGIIQMSGSVEFYQPWQTFSNMRSPFFFGLQFKRFCRTEWNPAGRLQFATNEIPCLVCPWDLWERIRSLSKYKGVLLTTQSALQNLLPLSHMLQKNTQYKLWIIIPTFKYSVTVSICGYVRDVTKIMFLWYSLINSSLSKANSILRDRAESSSTAAATLSVWVWRMWATAAITCCSHRLFVQSER